MTKNKTYKASPKEKSARKKSVDWTNVKYLDPKVDLTFRRIFGEHPDLLINFLNAVMPFPSGRTIVDIEYLPPELMPDNPKKKYSIVDVRCKDNFDRMFIIEMQVLWNSDFYNRIVFNAGKAYVKQMDQGDDYSILKPVYTLGLINENFDHKTKKFYHHYQIVNRHNTNEVIPGLEFVLIELTDKFSPLTFSSTIWKGQERAVRKLMVLWLRFLKEINEKTTELPSEMQKNAFINKAAELCERAAYTPEELTNYEAYKEHIRIERAVRDGTRRDALAEGEEIGLQIGLQKGEEIGLQKEKVEAAIRGFKKGHSIEIIAEFTDLTTEQVIKILKDNGLM